MYTEEQLISFGNYLLSTYDVKIYSTDGKNIPLAPREVSQADRLNWLSTQTDTGIKLPSAHQIGDAVWLALWSSRICSEINAVHFYEGKVKYDLKVFGEDGGVTRLYNVDSAFVTKGTDEEQIARVAPLPEE